MEYCGTYGGRTKAGEPCRNAARKKADGTYGRPCYLADSNPLHVIAPETPKPETPPVEIPTTEAEQIAAIERLALQQAMDPATPLVARLEYLRSRAPEKWAPSVKVVDAGGVATGG